MIITLQKPNADLSLYGTGHVLGNPLQGPGSLHPPLDVRPAEPAVSGSPVECDKTRSQGCVQNTVDDMKCAHGTYVDMCNRCQCAKVRSVFCGVCVLSRQIIAAIIRHDCPQKWQRWFSFLTGAERNLRRNMGRTRQMHLKASLLRRKRDSCWQMQTQHRWLNAVVKCIVRKNPFLRSRRCMHFVLWNW